VGPGGGDSVTDTPLGEVCDDGNTVSGDDCSADCTSDETCGNGIVDVAKSEQCDNGGLNSNNPNATCRTSCQRQKCGDSIVDNVFGEGCDLGASNSNAANATCRLNCTPRRCGDNIVDNASGELCDDGNNTSGDNCSADCTSLETCGNGIVDTAQGEECDAGAANSNSPNAACRIGCRLPTCGDSIIDNLRGEVCDAGMANSNAPDATCRLTCLPPKCGDNVIDPMRGEVCDDGNIVSSDGCRSDCNSNETCGNGVLDPQVGEQCDDGNTRAYDGCSACAPESIVVLIPGSAPPARELPVLVYDGARQRVVMFGGRSGSINLDDTWQWDGASWIKLTPVHSPAPRYGAAAAYDAERNRIVMFGGTTANGVAGDTWEFDGADWVQKNPTTSPAARTGAAMAFDANRSRVIMFGGTNGTPNQETWEWTGTTWNLLNPAFKPTARDGARMAFDSNSSARNVVMFGGSGGDTNTYVFDSTGNWVDRGSTAGPTPGADQIGMTYDASISRVVVWGGTATTYEWSGAAWSAVAGGPTTPRSNIVMTYDAARQRVVLFGGVNGAVPYADTWVRAAAAWSQPPALALPPARTRSASAYDPLRKRVVMFGGQTSASRLTSCTNNNCFVNDTWEWDGRQWLSVAATTPPSLRGGTQMDYDPNARTMRLYGGDYVAKMPSCVSTLYTNMYSYNGAGYTLNASGGRQAARIAGGAFDVAAAPAGRFVTFGGIINDSCSAFGTEVNTTWVWTASGGWVNAMPGTSPSARDNVSLAYDRIRNRTVMFSGNPRDGSTVADTWEWNNSTWTRITTTSAPNPRFNHRSFFNPDAGRVVVFGNSGYATGEDVWEWDGVAWTQRTQLGQYPTRYAPAVTYDAASHTIVAFGGRDNDLTSFSASNTFGLLQSRPNAATEACTSSTVDYDKDGAAGCLDDECWAVCDALHPPGTTRPAGAPFCGDSTCNGPESCAICPGDCGACTGTCGNFHCDSGETIANCPNDC
jgi:cysteine-rich repeat protein